MLTFKKGTIVSAKPDAPYSITNQNMLKGEVIRTREEDDDNIYVKILEHTDRSNVGVAYWVLAKYFFPTDCPKTVVHTQDEWDAVPADFAGIIEIDNGENWILVQEQKGFAIHAVKRSSVKGNATVEAWGNATVRASDNATVEAWGNASVQASDNATVEASDNATVEAWGNATVRASGNATVRASDSATVRASDSATVRAWGNATVRAWGNATVEASGNVQIVDQNCYGELKTFANSRIVFMPRNLQGFLDFHGVEQHDGKVILYKAVRGDELHSSHDSGFFYKVGETKTHECDPDTSEDCGRGLHVATLQWALEFGKDWDDLRIIECEVPIDKIVYPKESSGKVRTCELKVLRVVPLEECGAWGKILAKKQAKLHAE